MKKSLMYQKPPSQRPPTPSQPRLQKPRPEFTTDFTDYSKYKLTQQQMQQKKNSLQSKNKEAAKLHLQQRRKKLEMGVVDDDTKKVYEQAFKSKGIDLNPPLRRNLSQMISYEKEIRESARDSSRDNNNNPLQRNSSTDFSNSKSYNRNIPAPGSRESIEKELQHTKEFIKKVERANKTGDINRALEILESESQYMPYRSSQLNRSRNNSRNKHQQSREAPPLTPLQGLKDTLNFMEQKLFKKTNPEDSRNKGSLSYTPILETEDFQTQRSQEDSQVSFSRENNAFTPSINSPMERSTLSKIQSQLPKKPIKQQTTATLKDIKSSATNAIPQTLNGSVSFSSPQQMRYDESPAEGWMDTIQRMNNLLQQKQQEFSISNRKYYEGVDWLNSPPAQPAQQKSKPQQPLNQPPKTLVFRDQNYDYSNLQQPKPQANNPDKMSQASSKRNFEEEIDFSLTINNDDESDNKINNSLRIDSDQFFFDATHKLQATGFKPQRLPGQTYIDNTTSIKKYNKSNIFSDASALHQPSTNLVQESDPDDAEDAEPVPLSNIYLKKQFSFGRPQQQAQAPVSLPKKSTFQVQEKYALTSNAPPNKVQVKPMARQEPVVKVSVDYNSQVVGPKPAHQKISNQVKVGSDVSKIKKLLQQTKKGLQSLQIPDFEVPLVNFKGPVQPDCISLKRSVR